MVLVARSLRRALLASPGCGPHHRTIGRAVIVLGFDGLDFSLTRDLMAQGRLPQFHEVAARAGSLRSALRFRRRARSPGRLHHRARPGRPRHLRLRPPRPEDDAALPVDDAGRAAEPLCLRWDGGASADRRTRGTAQQGRRSGMCSSSAGIDTTIVRMPRTSRRPGTATRELSGMGTPDLLGTYGTFRSSRRIRSSGWRRRRGHHLSGPRSVTASCAARSKVRTTRC